MFIGKVMNNDYFTCYRQSFEKLEFNEKHFISDQFDELMAPRPESITAALKQI